MTKPNPYLARITLDNGYIMQLDFYAINLIHKMCGINLLLPQEGELNLTPDVLQAFYYGTLKRHQSEITEEEAGDMIIMYPNAFGELMEASAATNPVAKDNKKKSK